MRCFFATDLHGRTERYEKLLAAIIRERPDAIFLGGDLFPRLGFLSGQSSSADFFHSCLVPLFSRANRVLGDDYPDILLILGNDDPRAVEEDFQSAPVEGLWHYIHGRKLSLGGFPVYGYACVPPTPFLLKDWECYDVSRYVPPGSVSPEEGRRSVAVEDVMNMLPGQVTRRN